MKLIKKHNNKKGFTLVELVIVIAILAVLALILVPAISGYVEKSNTAKDQASARSIYTNAILANSTEELAAEILSKTAELSNTDVDKIDIFVKDGQVTHIVYVAKNNISFDGKDFDSKNDEQLGGESLKDKGSN